VIILRSKSLNIFSLSNSEIAKEAIIFYAVVVVVVAFTAAVP